MKLVCGISASIRARDGRFIAYLNVTLPTQTTTREDKSWKVAPAAPGLNDRRVEITGPTERKMTINALNSGAKVWLADLEDSNTPLWENVINGQLNLLDAITRTIDFTNEAGKTKSAPRKR